VPKFVLEWWKFGAPERMKLGTRMSLWQLGISRLKASAAAATCGVKSACSEAVRGRDRLSPHSNIAEKRRQLSLPERTRLYVSFAPIHDVHANLAQPLTSLHPPACATATKEGGLLDSHRSSGRSLVTRPTGKADRVECAHRQGRAAQDNPAESGSRSRRQRADERRAECCEAHLQEAEER
jgi:hypothetical protein